jgi:hypothetical protein
MHCDKFKHHRSKELSQFFFVRAIEKLFKVRFSGYPLYLLAALGASLIACIFALIVVLVGNSFLDAENVLSQSIHHFYTLFLVLFVFFFLSSITPYWFKLVLQQYEKQTVVLVGLISIAALAVCVGLLVTVHQGPIDS